TNRRSVQRRAKANTTGNADSRVGVLYHGFGEVSRAICPKTAIDLGNQGSGVTARSDSDKAIHERS
ncbi:MAG: hypothetical protein V3S51_06050, partial [Dehalococcoidia bacterium]